jgi:hypothetical protein
MGSRGKIWRVLQTDCHFLVSQTTRHGKKMQPSDDPEIRQIKCMQSVGVDVELKSSEI